MHKPQDKHDAQDYPTERIGDKPSQERHRGGNEQNADYKKYRIHRARYQVLFNTAHDIINKNCIGSLRRHGYERCGSPKRPWTYPPFVEGQMVQSVCCH